MGGGHCGVNSEKGIICMGGGDLGVNGKDGIIDVGVTVVLMAQVSFTVALMAKMASLTEVTKSDNWR